MPNHQKRHDVTDETWRILSPLLPGQRGQWGGTAEDNRRFLNCVFRVLPTGAPWRDMPPQYGNWNSVYQRFHRWRNSGLWEKILKAVIIDPDFEWLMIDASHCKVHPPRGRRRGRQSRYGAHKRGLNTKIHLTVDANGMPVGVLVTAGTTADCKEALELIAGYAERFLLADRGYDTNDIVDFAIANGIEPVIPPKRNPIEQRDYDHYPYKLRHLVENAFLHLKRLRGIATRYAKTTSSFVAAIQIRCIALCCAVLPKLV